MRKIDFQKHNEEVKIVWETFSAGNPIRVPMSIGINPRYTMWNYEINIEKYNFEDYFKNPEIMLRHMLRNADFVRHNVPFDTEMGLPAEGWDIGVDFQNCHEAAWFGCHIHFPEGQVPCSTSAYKKEEDKFKVFEKGMPQPYEGIYAKGKEFFEFFKEKQKSGFEYKGKPIRSVSPVAMGTDGPLTVCCDIRGTTEFMMDLLCDEDYALKLLDFVTEATINRILTYRRDLGADEKQPTFGFADDNIELLSVDMYKDLILPFHKKFVNAVSLPGSKGGIHICGNAQRHHKTLAEELNVNIIDTGFPMDFENARDLSGPDVCIYGGPSIPFLETHGYEDVYKETKRVLESGIADTGKFVMIPANNLPGSTSINNIWAMYDCVRENSKYTL